MNQRKILRRKIRQKISTVAKKLINLTDCGCDVLLIIKNKANQHWTVYSNENPELIFFSFQNAKEHLQTVEEMTKKTLKVNPDFSTYEQKGSQPDKMMKMKENEEFQTIVSAGNLKLESKMGMSTVSTDVNSVVDLFMSQKEKQHSSILFERVKNRADENSSPDFDFETYFADNS